MKSSSFSNNLKRSRQQELVSSQELLQATLDSSQAMIQVFQAVRDEQGKIVDFTWVLNNHTSERYYGDVIGQSLLTLNPGVVDEGVFETFKKVVETGISDLSERRYFHEQFEGWFYQSAVKLGDGVATHTLDITGLKDTQARLAHNQALLQSVMDSTLDIIQVFRAVRDEMGNVIDFEWVMNNLKGVQQNGDVIGKSLLKQNPGVVETGIFDHMVAVFQTGVPHEAEQFYAHEQFENWYYQAIVKTVDGVTMTTRDITAQKQQQQAFYLKFSDILRAEQDADSITNKALQMLLEHLQLDRCYVGVYQLEEDRGDFTHQVGNERVPPVPKQVRLSDFPNAMQVAYEQTLIINNIMTADGFSTLDRQNLSGLGYAALVASSLRRGANRPFWSIVCVSAQPRHWSLSEIHLIEEITERTWVAIEQARTNAMIRESENKYRTLFESIDEGFHISELIYDQTGEPVDWRYLEHNAVFERQTGLENVGGQLGSIVAPGTEPYWLQAYDQVLKTGKPLRLEAYHEYTDRWYSAYASRVGGPGSRHFVVVFDDITERKRREVSMAFLNEVNQDLARLKDIVHIMERVGSKIGEHFTASGCAFLEIDEEKNTSSIIYQWSIQGVVGENAAYPLLDFASEEVSQTARAGQILAVADTAENANGNYENCRASGIASFLHIPYLQHGKWQFSMLIYRAERHQWRQDETQLARQLSGAIWMRQQRARAEQALQKADRRKDEFLAMLAHELRNPISTIWNGVSLLKITHDKDADTSEVVRMMDNQVTHLVRMVDDLLDVSRVTQGKIELKSERVEIGTLIRNTVDAFQPQYQGRGKMLYLNQAPGSLYVQGDPTRLSQVITNLLTNSLRYTGDNGQVWVSLSSDNDMALIRVKDNGLGLTTEQQTSVFELFVQADNSLARTQGGLGVGLTLVRRLVELHGGSVQAESPGLGLGTEFTVQLPLLDISGENVPELPDVSAKQSAVQILLIDDVEDLAKVTSMLLKLKGYHVDIRLNGKSGAEAIEILKPQLVLCDIGMPDLDGYQTAALIRQGDWGGSVALVALSGYGQNEDIQRSKQAGFDAHLTKPIDMEELQLLINDLTKNK